MPRRVRSSRDSDPAEWELNVNQVVAFNLRAARKRKNWTQEALADEITRLSGTRCTHTMVSELERAWDGERRREFDAQEIAVLAAALKVPIAYFFLPPPDEYRNLEQLGRPASELHLLLFGYFDTAEILDERMREVGKNLLPEDEEMLPHFTGKMGPWLYRERRKELVMALLDGMADKVDQAFDTIGEFADRARKAGIRGYVAEQANDRDFAVPPENRPNCSDDTEQPPDSPSSEPLDGPSPERASARQGSR